MTNIKTLEAEALALQTCVQVLGELSEAGRRRCIALMAAAIDTPAAAEPSRATRRPSKKPSKKPAAGGRPLSGASEKALKLLGSGQLPSKVARELKMTRSAVSGVAYRAMRDGLLERAGRGSYRAVEPGAT